MTTTEAQESLQQFSDLGWSGHIKTIIDLTRTANNRVELADHIYLAISDYAKQSRSESDLKYRALWKHEDGEYIINRDPWAQSSAFHHYLAFWDDERLRGWGYFPARSFRRSFAKFPELPPKWEHLVKFATDQEWQSSMPSKDWKLEDEKYVRGCDSCPIERPCRFRYARARMIEFNKPAW